MRKNLVLKWMILLTGIVVVISLFAASYFKQQGETFNNKSVVYRSELGDMFSMINLSSDEVETMFSKELSEILTWNDTYQIFDKLGYYNVIPDRTSQVVGEQIPRDQFAEIYTKFLNQVGVEVTENSFIYFGHVPNESSILTENGNYDTSLTKEFFTYGETYKALCDGNKILFISDVSVTAYNNSPVPDDTSQSVASENTEISTVKLPSTINVVLTNDNHQEPMRDSFQIKVSSPCSVTCGKKKQTFDNSKTFSVKNLATFFENENAVMIIPEKEQSIQIKEADTGNWSAPYRGILFIYKKDDKYWLVNQVSLEKYLYGVVPGEMPERFHLEALKAQAVCARTYACNMISSDAYKDYYADVDDSVNCQVYNKNGENEKAKQAVDETAGVVLLAADDSISSFNDLNLAQIYYFSTSCGFTTGLEAWGDQSLNYLTSVTTLKTPVNVNDWDWFLKQTNIEAYDSGSNYFRWTAEVTLPEGWTLAINQREKSGVVTKITYKSKDGNRTVSTENDIRRDLGYYVTKMTDKEGKEIDNMNMLPSAWFTIERTNVSNKYILYGGGYGHGIGMSQYGAHGMAKNNMDYTYILEYYFSGAILKKLV